MDAILLPSPYASSFGGFVDLAAVCWFGFGGVLSSVLGTSSERRRRRTVAAAGEGGEVLPEDMSTTSLMGGGLIAGEALFALGLGLFGLLRLL